MLMGWIRSKSEVGPFGFNPKNLAVALLLHDEILYQARRVGHPSD